jgi:hypothetical protein
VILGGVAYGFDPGEFEKERNLHLKKLAKSVL